MIQKLLVGMTSKNNFFNFKNDPLKRLELKSKLRILKITMIKKFYFDLKKTTYENHKYSINFRWNFQFWASNLIEKYWCMH